MLFVVQRPSTIVVDGERLRADNFSYLFCIFWRRDYRGMSVDATRDDTTSRAPCWIALSIGRGRAPLSMFRRNKCNDRCRGSSRVMSVGMKSLEDSKVPYRSTSEAVPVGPAAFRSIPDCDQVSGGSHQKAAVIPVDTTHTGRKRGSPELRTTHTLFVGGLTNASKVSMSR